MAEGPPSFSISPQGGDAFDQLLIQVRSAAEGAYDVLGELGRSTSGNVVYLGRELESGHLVALKLSRAQGQTDEFDLEVVRTLDESLPGLENKCPECKAVLPDWDRFCFQCGADLAGAGVTPGAEESAQLLAAVKEATAGEYEILGKMDQAEGGGVVFFARDISRGKLVALRLRRDETGDPQQAAYSIGETQVFRPHSAEWASPRVSPPVSPPPPPPPAASVPLQPAAVPRPTRTGPVASARRPPPIKLIGAGVAVVGILVIGMLVFRGDGEESPPPPPPAVVEQLTPPPAPAVESVVVSVPPPPPQTTGVSADSAIIAIDVVIPAGGRLTVDGRAAGRGDQRVAPGTRVLALTAPGYQPVRERVTVRPGQRLVWRPRLTAADVVAQSPAPPPPPPPPSASPTCSGAISGADWSAASSLCTVEAERGDAVAQRHLAVLYDEGRGVTQDRARAVTWFTKASASGDLEAKERLGYMYRDGLGTRKDERLSTLLLRQAAEGGRVRAQLELGVALDVGRGVEVNDREAARWYQKAAEAGLAPGARRLGRLYEQGDGVARNDAEAAKWYRVAGDKGDRDAQYLLGRQYKEGRGVEKSVNLALEWFKKAAALGHVDAAAEVRRIERP